MQQYRMLIHRQAEGGPRFWQEERELITRSNTTINAQWPGPLLLTSPTLEERQTVLLRMVAYTPIPTLDPLEASQPLWQKDQPLILPPSLSTILSLIMPLILSLSKPLRVILKPHMRLNQVRLEPQLSAPK